MRISPSPSYPDRSPVFEDNVETMALTKDIYKLHKSLLSGQESG